ncbi:hypothetical protein [Congregibacter litoralis]|uniref:Uncharacterized protein n=1 Tax=Congregibacter litoralis KT71 TaxID=314285 RepID=V7HV82_9GAMM|nr:hypothetical protein [Congregibacter litoralis]ESZ89442.1 hypothetical protein KT71_002522 [Congregibacter litoralis KT71]
MKPTIALIGLVFSTLAVADDSGSRGFPVLEGPYMGQEAPGMRAEVFAPGVISTEASERSRGFLEVQLPEERLNP